MKDFYEHLEVLGEAGTGIGVSYIDLDHGLRLLILLGTLIFVWRRALKRRHNNKNDQ